MQVVFTGFNVGNFKEGMTQHEKDQAKGGWTDGAWYGGFDEQRGTSITLIIPLDHQDAIDIAGKKEGEYVRVFAHDSDIIGFTTSVVHRGVGDFTDSDMEFDSEGLICSHKEERQQTQVKAPKRRGKREVQERKAPAQKKFKRELQFKEFRRCLFVHLDWEKLQR